MLIGYFLFVNVAFGLTSNNLYKKMAFPSSVWPNYIFKVANTPKSLIECTAVCSSSPNCDGFNYAPTDTCHLADLNANLNIIGSQIESNMFVNLAKLEEQKKSQFDQYDVTGLTYWHSKISSSRIILDPATELDCLNDCTNVVKSNCDFFVYDNLSKQCYIGQLSATSGDGPNPALIGNATLFAKRSQMELKLATITNLRPIVPTGLWYKYIYSVKDSVSSLTECGGNCYMDTITPCHFYVYTSNTCHLGVFNQSNSLVEPSSSVADVYLNRETMSSYVHDGFVLVHNAYYYHEYSVNEIPNALNEDMCKVMCLIDTNCHYSTFKTTSLICQLGSYSIASTAMNKFGNAGTLRTFINPLTVTNAQANFYSVFSADDIWPTKITTIRADVAHKEICAGIAMLDSLQYNLYYYNESSLTCYLGAFTTSGTLVPTVIGSTTEIYLRKTHVETVPNDFSTGQFLAGSDWSQRMFTTLQSETFHLCRAMCKFHDKTCQMFAYSAPTCYLGHPNTIYGNLTSTTSLYTYGNYDSMWGTWGSWSSCDMTCNSGNYATMSRWRQCDNPSPKYGGRNCPACCNYDIAPCNPMPSNCPSLRINTYDNPMSYSCPSGLESISYSASYFSSGSNDREYYVQCGVVNKRRQRASCYWTGYLNSMDNTLPWTYCSGGGFLTGLESFHSNNYEDRQFKMLCCSYSNTCLRGCFSTGLLGSQKGSMAYTNPTNFFINGIYAVHEFEIDRRFRYYLCEAYEC